MLFAITTAAFAMEKELSIATSADVRLEFSVHTLDKLSYQLCMNVHQPESSEIYVFSCKALSAIEQTDGDYYNYALSILDNQASMLVDLWPVNGTWNSRQSRFITNLFKTEIQKELCTQASLASKMAHPPHIRLFVLDLKDGEGHYKNGQKIALAESRVVDLIRMQEHPVAKLLNQNRVLYLVREGFLKALVLRALSENTVAYLEDKKGPGPQLLCILCEFLINGFKRGYGVVIEHNNRILAQLHPRDFFRELFSSSKEVNASPAELAQRLLVLQLQTYYSPYYSQLYGKDSLYYQLISQLYKTEHVVDQATSSTIITLHEQDSR